MKKIFLLIFVISINSHGQTPNISYSIKNLEINTQNSDFGTFYYGEKEAVFISIKTYNNNELKAKLVKGKILEDGKLEECCFLNSSINEKYLETQISFSKNIQSAYFTRHNYSSKKSKNTALETKKLKIFKSIRDRNGRLSKIIDFFPYNSRKYSTAHPMVHEASKKIYFISDMPGGYGETDVYVCEMYADGSFSKPRNLGPTINTSRKELYPFVSDDNTLYYASNGRNGFGGFDVYASKIIDEEYTKPIHLPEPINSADDDFSFVVGPSGNEGYFTSNRPGGKGLEDIYYFSTGNKKLEYAHKKKTEKHIAPKNNNKKSIQTQSLKTFLGFDKIYFNVDKFDLHNEAADELNKIVAFMKENPEIVIEINTHTDSRASEEYNWLLSFKRGREVLNYMIGKGISKNRIYFLSFGEIMLANKCSNLKHCSYEEHKTNRRAEFKIVDAYPDKNKIHFVKKGETLYSISKQYGISVDDLKRSNGFKTNTIFINHLLFLP